MQEALNNPHYKKIWETVIINRHPEAKSFEEALQKEMQHPHCVYILFGNLHITENNQIRSPIHESVIILGRPITLEDVILFLPTNSTHFIKNVDGSLQIKIFGIDDVGCDFFQGQFDWLLTKHLHKQSPETWEKIANLI
jgi:hypothetical protein